MITFVQMVSRIRFSMAVAIAGVVALNVAHRIDAAEQGSLLWRFATEGPVYASPTVGPDGTVYIGSNDGMFYALSAGWGDSEATLKWSYQADDWIDASAAIGPDGSVYVATYSSTLAALDPESGQERWKITVGESDGQLGVLQGSPAIAADGTIVSSSDAGFLFAIRPDGTEKWSFDLGAPTRSSPAIGSDGTIYVGVGDGTLKAVDADGGLRWSFSVSSGQAGRIHSSPAIDDKGNIYFGSGDGYLYSLNPAGNQRWRYETLEPVDVSPAIDSIGRVYFATRNGSVICLDNDGALVWSKFLGDIFYSSPIIDAQGFVYITYFGGQNRSFLISMAPGGEELWEYQVNAVVDSSLTLSPDGILYFGAFDGDIYAVQGRAPLDYTSAWPRFRKDLRSRGRVMEGEVPAVPWVPNPLAVPTNSPWSLTVELDDDASVVHWRRNGKSLELKPGETLFGMKAGESDVGVYDVIVSNEFGETIMEPTFVTLLDEVLWSGDTLSARLVRPAGDSFGFQLFPQYSEDLVIWSETQVVSDLLGTNRLAETEEVRLSVPASGDAAFLRIVRGNE